MQTSGLSFSLMTVKRAANWQRQPNGMYPAVRREGRRLCFELPWTLCMRDY